MNYPLLVLLLLAVIHRIDSFKVIWNVPGFMCRPYGISFTDVVDKFGFTKNSDEYLKGEVISLLYEPGMFPALLNATKEANNVLELIPKNGGIPQKGNLELHLKAFERMLEKYIPADNGGLIVIDMEEWYPQYELNTGINEAYQTMSKYTVIKDHPELESEPNKVEAMAKESFDNASKIFMSDTLTEGHKLRPKGVWGFYLYPLCNLKPQEKTCAPEVVEINNHMTWLYNLSSALYPSLYLSSGSLSDEDRAEITRARTSEAMRVAALDGRSLPVYPYISINYQDNGNLISKADLENVMKIPKELGAKGVILWSSRSLFQMEDQCEKFNQFLEETLGPLVKEIVA